MTNSINGKVQLCKRTTKLSSTIWTEAWQTVFYTTVSWSIIHIMRCSHSMHCQTTADKAAWTPTLKKRAKTPFTVANKKSKTLWKQITYKLLVVTSGNYFYITNLYTTYETPLTINCIENLNSHELNGWQLHN